MAKRGSKVKESEELTNFPEDKPIVLLSPRYLAVAASLILVFSAFASLLIDEEVTGQATSATMSRWREEGLGDTWRRYDTDPDINNVDEEGRQIPSESWLCPFPLEKRLSPPSHILTNKEGCFNMDKNTKAPYAPFSASTSRDFGCLGVEESGRGEVIAVKSCTRM